METINLKFYKIVRVLGKGGMATVYLAKHRLLQNKVAIKVLNKEFLYNSNIKNRFISEAKKLAQLDHPNIVRVVDLLDNEDQIAFVMEYLEGESLKDALQQKKLNDSEIEDVLKQMVSALSYVHKEGLIHRDIKPSNFIFDKRGNLKLTDFGISKDTLAQNSEYTQTATHINMGTPMYMSPEQIRSLKDVTKLTDIYSLGVVLWEMVSGKKPYSTQTLSSFELQTKIVNESLPLTNTKWDGLIQKATQKAEEERLNNLNYFLNPEQIELEEEHDDEKTVIYSNKQKKKNRSKSSKEKKRKNHGLVYILIAIVLVLIAGLILRSNMENESALDKIISIKSEDLKEPESTSLSPSKETEEIIEEEKFVDKSDFRYRSKIKRSSDYKYLSNLSHEGKITEFLKAEDEENWEVIVFLFSGKGEKYWDIKEPTYKNLYTTYHNNWKKTSYRKNDVKSINKLNKEEYKVEVTYHYTEASGGVRKRVDNDIYFKFDNAGEIVAVDEFSLNNIELTEEERTELRERYFKNYDYVGRFSEGLARVRLNGKWGFIDKLENEVIPFKYDYANDFSEGLASVQLNGKYGFIDKLGNEVIPLKYDSASSFSEGLASVGLSGNRGFYFQKHGFINKAGVEVIPFKYDEAHSFSEGLASVRLNDKHGFRKWGFIDKLGNEVIPFKYDAAGSFSEGLARVRLNGKWGFIDKFGNEVIPFKYDAAGSFSEGLARVRLNGKWGFIDKLGNEVIPFKYDFAWYFSEGLASVKLNDKWGFIDKLGNEIISLKYDFAGRFIEGSARVELNSKRFYINKKGECVRDCENAPLKHP